MNKSKNYKTRPSETRIQFILTEISKSGRKKFDFGFRTSFRCWESFGSMNLIVFVWSKNSPRIASSNSTRIACGGFKPFSPMKATLNQRNQIISIKDDIIVYIKNNKKTGNLNE